MTTPNQIPVTPFHECRMSPRGVWSLVQHFRTQPLLQHQPESRLRAMAIAFLAHGGTNDNQHDVPIGALHPAHILAHRNDQILTWRNHLHDDFRNSVMDMLTWLDRLSGGGTILVHAPGTRPPRTPAIAEEARLDVFLPIVLLRELPFLSPVFARLVQYVAEHIAVPVMHRWDEAKNLQDGGALNNPATPRRPSRRGENQPLIPPSPTPYHAFYGRAPGVVETLIANLATPAPPPVDPTAVQPALVSTTPSATDPAPSFGTLTAVASTPPNSPAPSRSSVTPSASRSAARTPRSSRPSKGKRPIKEEPSEDEWVRDDVVDLAESMERAMNQAGPYSIPPPVPFLGARRNAGPLIDELQAHIQELERIICAQSDELARLNVLLSISSFQRSQATSRATSRADSPSSDTFGARGKGPAALHERPMSSGSMSSVSSVSSVSASTRVSRRGDSAGSRSSPPTNASAARAHPSASSSRGYALPPSSRNQPGYIFGRHTDHAVEYNELPSTVSRVLVGVDEDYDSADWLNVVLRLVPDCTDVIAQELVAAMRLDRGLPPL